MHRFQPGDHDRANMSFTDPLPFNIPDYPFVNGGYCNIYRSQTSGGKLVAIKMLRNPQEGDDSQFARDLCKMTETIPIWAKCNHPNIVPLIGEATVRGQVAAVYEWLTYGSVLDYLKRHPTADRHQLSAKICGGVAYLHANNIIHGGLRGSQVFVSDYGVPRIMLDCMCTHMVGKPMDAEIIRNIRWMAPEILTETSGNTFQSDVYALSMTILETITLNIPYYQIRMNIGVIKNIMNQQSPLRPMDTIPDNEAGNVLWDLLTACWSHDPKERPSAADIGEVMNALGSSQPATQVHQRPSSSMGFAPDTVIEDLVAFFVNNNLTDYTEELKGNDMKIQLSKPYLATAAALLFKIVLPIKGGHQNTIYNQKVVVKRVMNESPYKQLKRATRELYFWSEYKHENILPLLGFAVLDGNLAMISPWIDNGSVTEYVRKQQKPDYHDLCTQLSCAICYLHGHGLIHGDIKGDNVLVSDEGIVKVTDFGVSIAAQLQIEFTFTAVGRGTERWQAPEILRRKTDSTKAGDVYSLGMTMLEIYSRERPYGDMEMGHDEKCAIIAGTLRPKRPWRIPLNSRGRAFWELLQQCWAGEAEARPSSDEVYKQLVEM